MGINSNGFNYSQHFRNIRIVISYSGCRILDGFMPKCFVTKKSHRIKLKLDKYLEGFKYPYCNGYLEPTSFLSSSQRLEVNFFWLFSNYMNFIFSRDFFKIHKLTIIFHFGYGIFRNKFYHTLQYNNLIHVQQ